MAVLVGTAALAGLAVWAVLALRPEALPEAPQAPATPEVSPAEQDPAALRYAAEYPAIGYAEGDLTDPVARLRERLATGAVTLEFAGERGYLDSVLAALEIDVESQVLVFSKTSLQIRGITPETPRAIFFNDSTYVAWTRGAPTIEIASMDPNVGPVFLHARAERGGRRPVRAAVRPLPALPRFVFADRRRRAAVHSWFGLYRYGRQPRFP